MSDTPRWHADRRGSFYKAAAWGALAVAFAGFFLTYTRPMLRGEFMGPRWSHIHGALLLAWLLLVIAQAHLASTRLAVHRRLGWIAVALAPAVAASIAAIGLETTRRDLPAGGPVGMAGNVTLPFVFCVLVGAAIVLRGKPQWHKRLILIATVVVIWPAWFRWRHFLPWVPRPEVTLGLIVTNLVLVGAMLRDRIRFGAVHPAYASVGLPVSAWQTVETFAFGSTWWNRFGLWLYELAP